MHLATTVTVHSLINLLTISSSVLKCCGPWSDCNNKSTSGNRPNDNQAAIRIQHTHVPEHTDSHPRNTPQDGRIELNNTGKTLEWLKWLQLYNHILHPNMWSGRDIRNVIGKTYMCAPLPHPPPPYSTT